MSCFCFLSFNDFCQTNCLKNYHIDLCQIFGPTRDVAIAINSIGFDHRRLAVQPGGLTFGFALHLVLLLFSVFQLSVCFYSLDHKHWPYNSAL